MLTKLLLKILLLPGTVLFLFPVTLKSQNLNLRFDHISTENGLSHGTVNCIYQDNVGFMWFGTVDGLNRFDGYSFKLYKNDPKNKSSLSGNNITSITEDSLGFLLIGTRNNGLNVFNRSNEEFIRYNYEKGNKFSLSNNSIRTIFIDSKNRIWIGTLGGGLNLFDNYNKSFVNFKHDPKNSNSISDDYVYSIIEDSSGILWIGAESGELEQLLMQYIDLQVSNDLIVQF